MAGVETVIQIVFFLILGLLGLLAIASLVYFILVVVQMFKHEQVGLGLASLVLTPCVGIGPLLAYVMGWVKAGEWGIRGLMWQWTGVAVFGMFMFCCTGVSVQIIGKNANSSFSTVGQSIGVTTRP